MRGIGLQGVGNARLVRPPMEGVAAPWSPADLNLFAWWDFASPSYLFEDVALTDLVDVDGDSIAGVNDKATTVDITGPDNARWPVYKTAIQNGLSVGRFTSDYLEATIPTNSFETGVLFAAATYKAAAGLSVLTVAGGGHGSLGNAFELITNSNMLFRAFGVSIADTVSSIDPGWHRFIAYVGASGTPIFWWNGVSKTCAAATATTLFTGQLRLCADHGLVPLGYYWSGDVGEAFYATGAYDAADFADIDNYLVGRWGL